MNVYLNKFLVYYEVHKLNRDNLSVSQISDYLVLNRRTVSKYLAMSEQEFEAFLSRQSNRRKQLNEYEDFVRERLEDFSNSSAAQIHDWLKEHHQDFPRVNAKTVFNFIQHIRDKHNLPKIKAQRQFQTLEEPPYGKQAQVDFGEYNMRCSNGKRAKVYFFALVLSRSRYKYIWFTDQPFTSQLAIEAHDLAFKYIMGVPDEVVYDQDKVFLVSENKGDLILTDTFRSYVQEQSFELHFCRKADPQSKGKVENVVKYVKQNFLYNRPFYNVETLNDEVLAWMGRTANALPHGFTKKEPYSQWRIEQPFLKEYRALTEPLVSINTYTVRKDNAISYKGNLYSLPLNTYKGKGTKVGLKALEGTLIISDQDSLNEICRHSIVIGSGKKVINTDHKRDKTAAIDEMITELCQLLPHQEKGRKWLAGIRKDKPRYIRDQVLAIKNSIIDLSEEHLSSVLDYCLENKIYSATDFEAIIKHMAKEQTIDDDHKVVVLNPLNQKLPKETFQQPKTSSLETYQAIIEANKSNKNNG